ncbi:MAG: glycosyltransferase family 2 protein [Timaviella obliquedivisa GSE-PSE-MK23-08B]|jgi:GT2 family glycosyltransferase|nr:glycosyltransferase family 2 protein [Timaviella obliquedivisa GSE-PSE-MK23-08B]
MNPQSPVFSIVIPTYNRPERLTTCLQSIAQLNYPCDRFEVIVVDDGSEAPLSSTVSEFEPQIQITLIRQTNAGPASARNTGANHAAGRFLVFTDDDCCVAPNYLEALEQYFTSAPDRLVGGQTLNALPDNLFSTASQTLINYLYCYYNAKSDGAFFFASNNFAMPTEQFRSLGGFSTAFSLAAGEDREFCDRWLHHGYQMSYAPEVKIYHAHKLTLRSFWRQHFNYGRGAFCFHQVRADRLQTGIKVEPFSFYSKLFSYPFAVALPDQAVSLVMLLFVSQVANVAGFFWERSRHLDKQIQVDVIS